MTISSFGDLAQNYQMRKQQSLLRSDIDRLSLELTTGRIANLSEAVLGDYRPIAAIENGLGETEAYLGKLEETVRFAEATQLSLSRVESTAQELGPQLALLSSEVADYSSQSIADDVEAAFSDSVRALNTRFAGRSLFGGTRTDVSPLSDGAAMLSELKVLVAGETTAAGVEAAVDGWFGPGGAFETTHYAGSTTTLTPFDLSQGGRVEFDTLASDDAFRSVLSGLAMGALLQDGPLTADRDESLDLARRASDRVVAGSDQVTELRGTVGSKEGRLEAARTELLAERSALDLARTNILEADPFEAASRLQEVQSQLEVLFSITARSSRLSLADYI